MYVCTVLDRHTFCLRNFSLLYYAYNKIVKTEIMFLSVFLCALTFIQIKKIIEKD